jgi:hypothetical protein
VAFALHRCLIPPPSRGLAASRRVGTAPGLQHAESPEQWFSLSRLNHTAFALAVYASQLSSLRRGCTATQDSLAAGGQPLPRGIGYPQGPIVKFQPIVYMASSSPRLRLAQAEVETSEDVGCCQRSHRAPSPFAESTRDWPHPIDPWRPSGHSEEHPQSAARARQPRLGGGRLQSMLRARLRLLRPGHLSSAAGAGDTPFSSA